VVGVNCSISIPDFQHTAGTIFENPNASTKRPNARDSGRTPGVHRAPPAFRRYSASVRPYAMGSPDAGALGCASIMVSWPSLALLASDAQKVN